MRKVTLPTSHAFLRFLETLEGYAATLAYTSVATLLIGDIVAREVFGFPMLGAESIAVLAAIVAGFLGLALATANGSHLRPAVFDNLLPVRFNPYLERGSDLVAAVFYFGIAYFALSFVNESRIAGDRAAILYFRLWPIELVMPYAFLSCAIRHLFFFARPALKQQKTADEFGLSKGH